MVNIGVAAPDKDNDNVTGAAAGGRQTQEGRCAEGCPSVVHCGGVDDLLGPHLRVDCHWVQG
jgi:hypothetical protein